MSDPKLLAGLRVLVVEDDYFLALDQQCVLEDAGAEVIGPCGDEASAMSAVQDDMDCAVLDLNLGAGPSFGVASALRAKAIPFVFATGYDASVIPAEFSDVQRLEKPIVMSDLVRAVCEISSNGDRMPVDT